MLNVFYNWTIRRDWIRPIVEMACRLEIIDDGHGVQMQLTDEEEAIYKKIIMEQAVEYVEYAKELGAKPIKRNRSKIKVSGNYFEVRICMKFKNRKRAREFEKRVIKG